MPTGFHQRTIGDCPCGRVSVGEGLRTVHTDCHKARNPFPIAHNHLGQFQADMVESGLKGCKIFRLRGTDGGVLGKGVRQHQDSVVGAHVAIHGDAIETLCYRFVERRLQVLRFDRGIGRDEGEHGGVKSRGAGGGTRTGGTHSRLNHSSTFADTSDRYGLSVEFHFDGNLFHFGVARHDRFRDVPGVFAGAVDAPCDIANSFLHIFHWHVESNATSRSHKHMFLREVKLFRQESRHFESVLHSLFAGACVGISRVYENGLGNSFLHPLHADLHRCGADLVGGEHPGDGGGHFGENQREIPLLPFLRTFAGAKAFDVTEHSGREETFGSGDGTGNNLEWNFHLDNRVGTETVCTKAVNCMDGNSQVGGDPTPVVLRLCLQLNLPLASAQGLQSLSQSFSKNMKRTLLSLLICLFHLGVHDVAQATDNSEKIKGLYVHMHWPYRHPYAARTWTVEDWRGFAGGLKQIGYNTILVWPMIETMPEPLTESDRAFLTKMGKVIDLIHEEFQMRVYVVVCPNIKGKAEASRATFEKRHYYYCDDLVNPGDPIALEQLVRWREKLLRPLGRMDGIAMIDSDPGCYPGSTTAEFVHLLGEHRKMLDRLRPNIELIYWMHLGWRGWSRYYEQGKYLFGTPEEQTEALTLLKAINPEPWSVANGLAYAEKLGIAEKVISFNYGVIEGEPSFPMSNFGGTAAYEGGKGALARGVMGNAQTHCIQLPNIFAFACGANGLPLTEADYLEFAEKLIPGQGPTILAAWKLLSGSDADAQRSMAEKLEKVPRHQRKAGPLSGLLFNDPRRFLNDLAMMLRMSAARNDFILAADKKQDLKKPLRQLISSVEVWQKQHGYENYWHDAKLVAALRQLKSPELKKALNLVHQVKEPFDPGVRTAEEQVRRNFRAIETHTPQVLAAMRAALNQME